MNLKILSRLKRQGPEHYATLIAPEVSDSFASALNKLCSKDEVINIVEIGSSSGLGSTKAIIDGALKSSASSKNIYCIEVSSVRSSELQKNLIDYHSKLNIKIINLSTIKPSDLPKNFRVIVFYFKHNTNLRKVSLYRILGWLKKDIKFLEENPSLWNSKTAIDVVREDTFGEEIDLVVIDGGEFSGYQEFLLFYGAKIIALDDVNSFKCYQAYMRLINDPEYELYGQDWDLRNGWAIFCRKSHQK